MKSKNEERLMAIRLRRKDETIPHIAQKLKVSKSSVSLWLRGVILPEKAHRVLKERKIQSRLLASQVRKNTTAKKLETADQGARNAIRSYTIDATTSLILCSLMYWCEGSKSKDDSEFTFTNSDPKTISGFLALLRKAFPLDENRFRVKMHLHEYHNEAKQKKLWSEVTKIPITQFQNTYWKINTGVSKKLNYAGCVHVRYHDVVVARKISAVARNFLSQLNVIK